MRALIFTIISCAVLASCQQAEIPADLQDDFSMDITYSCAVFNDATAAGFHDTTTASISTFDQELWHFQAFGVYPFGTLDFHTDASMAFTGAAGSYIIQVSGEFSEDTMWAAIQYFSLHDTMYLATTYLHSL